MSQKIRQCINAINKKKDIEKNLSAYLEESMILHDKFARLKLMMDYYMLYEIHSEGRNKALSSMSQLIEQINKIIAELMEGSCDCKKCIDEIEAMRCLIKERMEAVTAYVDCFTIYEYVLNRLQYRFEEKQYQPDDNTFSQMVMQFIFSSKDNVAINDNLRVVLGQLPMRMTRKHYFQLLRECLSVYKGSDVSALEGFVYMFRTTAMLYSAPDKENIFGDYEKEIEEFAGLDYESFDKESYDKYSEKLSSNAAGLNELSDAYVQLGQILNELYIITASLKYRKDDKDSESNLIEQINKYFNSGLNENMAEIARETFTNVEGKQEGMMYSINVAEAAENEIAEANRDMIQDIGLSEEYVLLHNISLLNTTSVFVSLDEEIKEEEKVTPQLLEQTAEGLIQELKEAFKGQSRMLRRAIMSATIEKFPTFFNSSDEIADYLIHSLNQCDNEAEKYASKQLILDLIS